MTNFHTMSHCSSFGGFLLPSGSSTTIAAAQTPQRRRHNHNNNNHGIIMTLLLCLCIVIVVMTSTTSFPIVSAAEIHHIDANDTVDDATIKTAREFFANASSSFTNSDSNSNSHQHTNNWAVLVCTSRFWFNYRHIANTLSFYHIVKQMGIPDDQIILMLADDVACNARNSYPGQIFNNANGRINLYGSDVQVDYRGYEVTVESFIRVLTGRHQKHVPLSKRLRTNEDSNVLVYLTGHGGNEFLKFQDSEEISAMDLADAIQQMHQKRRYHEMLLMVDTCQAGTMFNRIYSPGVVAVGSSRYAENSYSHHSNFDVGVAIIDRFTYFTLEFFERHHLYRVDVDADAVDDNHHHHNGRQSSIGKDSSQQTYYDDNERKTTTLGKMFSYYNPHEVMSHPVFRTDLSKRDVNTIPLTDFFAQDIKIDFTSKGAPLVGVDRAMFSEDFLQMLEEIDAGDDEVPDAVPVSVEKQNRGISSIQSLVSSVLNRFEGRIPLLSCLGLIGVLLLGFTRS